MMIKHRGFPGRYPGTDYQFVIRRGHKEGATKIVARRRYADRRRVDLAVDEAFMTALWTQFGDQPFERGNLDAGRLSWLFGREVIAAEDPFDPESYEALMRIDVAKARATFPRVFGRSLKEGAHDRNPRPGDDRDDE